MFTSYKNKKVTVVGLARSGMAAACLLKDLGAQVFVTDSAASDSIKALAQDLGKRAIEVETGGHTADFIRGKDLVVVSPGVSNESPSLAWARQSNIPIISEIELAWSVCPAVVVAITGTNGKTTVTTLIYEVLKTKGVRAFALGNIGAPFSASVLDMNCGDFVSLEVSSFQLEKIDKFKPKVAVILNFAPDHLDKEHRGYSGISEYLKAKKRIFMNQDKDDYLVLNYRDSVVKSLSDEAKAEVVFFNGTGKYKTLSHTTACLPAGRRNCSSGSDELWRAESSGRRPVSCKEMPLDNMGMSLNANHLAAMAVGSIFGVSEDACIEVFRNFKGVEHRLEHVCIIGGVDFINDSKATNVDSTNWALKNIFKQTILIAGGRDKNIDYRAISDLIKEKVKLLILIGEAKEKIRKAYDGLLPIKEASSLEEAVALSFSKASAGDCVLFSPMCASFDMFDNYEHRGKVFKEIVNKLKA